MGTLVASFLGAGVVLVNAESAIGIKSGARTGLASITCGLLFFVSTICYPLWSSIPLAGIGPVLLMVACLLFENTGKVKWEKISDALVVYITAIFSAFTYSVFHGVIFGSTVYCMMSIVTGDFLTKSQYGETSSPGRRSSSSRFAHEELEGRSGLGAFSPGSGGTQSREVGRHGHTCQVLQLGESYPSDESIPLGSTPHSYAAIPSNPKIGKDDRRF